MTCQMTQEIRLSDTSRVQSTVTSDQRVLLREIAIVLVDAFGCGRDEVTEALSNEEFSSHLAELESLNSRSGLITTMLRTQSILSKMGLVIQLSEVYKPWLSLSTKGLSS